VLWQGVWEELQVLSSAVQENEVLEGDAACPGKNQEQHKPHVQVKAHVISLLYTFFTESK